MATTHIYSFIDQANLNTIIENSIRDPDLAALSEDLRQHIRDQIISRADGKIIWAEFMLVVIGNQETEDGIHECLARAPPDCESMISEVIEVLNSTLPDQEIEELSMILAWLSCAARPPLLSEMEAMLAWTFNIDINDHSLKDRILEKYTSLIELVRDDGVSTRSLRMRRPQSSETDPPRTFDFIPEATQVKFSHETVNRYFKDIPGNAISGTLTQDVCLESRNAELALLRVCLEVFVNPGVQETFNTAQIPRPYAVAFWPHYLAQVVSALHERPFSQDKISILDLQHRFMTNEHILRAWCCDTTWSTCSLATVKNIATLAGRVGNQELETLSREFQDWILICKTNPTEVFLPAAKVYAEEGLHGDAWIPITAIEAIAQIKALIENGDTLDMDIDKLSQPLPLTTIMEAVHWAGLEETPTWHRKLGVCLRTCDYMAEAMEHFEMALELNLSLLLARSGLAILYEGQAFHEKAIELELANATALSLSEQYQHQTATGDSDSVELRRELCTSYEFIARNYETLKDFAHALQFWRKAFDTKEVHHWWFVTYLHRLATSSASAPTPKEDQDRWTEIMHLLKEAEKRPGPGFDNDNNNISFLTHCIMQNPQPGDSISAEGFQPNFFAVIATAAQNTGSTDWLENAYKMAIRSSKSHVLSIVLKYCVIKMLKSWADHDQWKKAEPYIEDIAAIATLARAGTGDGPRSEALDLHRCSVQIARDFGLICVRRVLESDMDVEVVKHYCQKLERFSGAGVATLGAWSEDNFQADIYIYIEPCSSV